MVLEKENILQSGIKQNSQKFNASPQVCDSLIWLLVIMHQISSQV